MRPGTIFESTEENWTHMLENYMSESEMYAKGGKKAVLPEGTPSFVKYFAQFYWEKTNIGRKFSA